VDNYVIGIQHIIARVDRAALVKVVVNTNLPVLGVFC